MHEFNKLTRTFVGLVVAGGLSGLTATATADVTVYGVDFGQSPGAADGCAGPSPLYSGEFDGTSGFVRMDISDCGVVESPSLDLGGGLTLSFTNVSGWNNTDGQPPESPQALTGDHFFTSGLGADDPAAFSVSGMNPNDILILEFADRRGGETAQVTFEGFVTLVNAVPDGDGSGEFTDVSGGGVTGSSEYFGSFTGGGGSGEGNLSAARITVISASGSCSTDLNGDGEVNGADLGDFLSQWGVCSDCTGDFNGDGIVNGADLGLLFADWGSCGGGGGGATGICCFGEACLQIGAEDCAAIGGEYGGDDTICEEETCVPPGPGPCCEINEAGIAGCIDLTCSYVVCISLPDCCDVAWDADCAAAALDLCNDCDGTTDYSVTAIDFGQSGGCGPSPLYTGAFDGIDGFVAMEISDCCAVENPTLDLGNGVTFQFANVSGWNNTDGQPASVPYALTGDHFLSAGCDAADPVSFQVSGLSSCDTLILEFADRRGGEQALVVFNGVTTLVDSVPDGDGSGTFTDVSGGGVTGQSSYSGTFTDESGVGEGNLAAARITIIPGDPDCDGGGGQGYNCDEAHGGLGCNDLICQELVCGIDPLCCVVSWDGVCADLAIKNCKAP